MFKSKAIKSLKMEENNATLDIRAINEKIERESAFIDLLTLSLIHITEPTRQVR
jgi:MoxR-like ATPase